MNKLPIRKLLELRRMNVAEIESLKKREANLRRANSDLREQIQYLTATLRARSANSRSKRP